MDRPASIVTFERLYLGGFAIGVINTIMSWSSTQALIATQTAQVPEAAEIISWLVPVTTVIGFCITMLLWYFIARRGAVVAKWILTILVAAAAVFMLLALAGGTYRSGLSGILGLLSTALQLVSIWFLFRPDTKVWFGEASV
ncbi:hypothetical protein G4G27_11995 [Sphingomonas sp. So64.6b]|uniref:hypothetical protein n=1 Tax=Sphingomonas sp. So64.6b TaxID=2997354 RepID=UPI0016015FE3|nr:hypothetical protein [Sphingomonas sp. So64.6b]QNA84626.1 hypothetical protein G4G27_11995 [Sphingomonas sp. So64.6b]